MSVSRILLATFCIPFLTPASLLADEPTDARKLIEKAIEAQGGEKLAKLPASTVKMKGTIHTMGQAVAFVGEVLSHGAERQKIDIEADIAGQKFRIVNVLNGTKGWTRFGDMVSELDKEMLTDSQEQAYSDWLLTLLPLRDKGFTFSVIGEAKIEKQNAVGIKVSHKGHRDVDLYFDKQTGLLVKAEKRVRDENTRQEVTEETFYAEYKEFQGTKQPTKFTVKRDGKLFLEGEATEYEFSEKLDAASFGKP
jgi:hypothetical protein